ncbi:MAG: Gfo/Idh/MocA family oxidoreductase [Pseudomonadota bacterium]
MSINVGIIGTGRIADMQLAPAMQQVSGSRLWSVLSRDNQRAEAFASRHGAQAPVSAHTSLSAFLADPSLEAVIVATPDGLHASHAIAAARAGKHVLLEKPMATTTEDAIAITDTCAQERVKLAIAYHLRWHDGHQRIAAMLHAGELGHPRYARAMWTWKAEDNSNWRAQQELGRWWGLAGVGTHCVDLLRWMLMPLCGEVTSCRGTIDTSKYGGPHDETASLSLQFEQGVVADVTTSVVFSAPSRFELYCDSATVVCENTLGPTGGGSIVINNTALDFDFNNPYVGEIQNFIDAIEGKVRVAVPGAEGIRNVELLVEATSPAVDL